ncbi:ABC transporter ATP-binding protein [Saccharothrix algeriensis]|uniref:ABC transporter ATP-binding protein n=1 Tax=Saccharothrix algeriensis TaxID=173560 RepID=A0A8T8I133_9PSEU|nr:ABC transporter ATP-binding protein [Saccharothrix algeriensis]MBM7810499.1 ATP-binding cassette subfamily B protein [Saccharothrix algeriensis]QTR04623.1 ABC transporter ATP-binding protein [Saccharothrix algeriensis]
MTGRGDFRRVLALLRPRRYRIAGLLGAVTLTALCTALPALAYQQIIDSGISRGDLGAVAGFSALAVGAVVTAAGAQWVGQWLTVSLSNHLGYELRTRIFDRVQRLGVDFHTARPTGDLLARLNSDVQAAQGIVSNLVVNIVANAVRLALVVAAMTYFSWELVGLALVAPVLAVPITWRTARVVKRLGERRQQGLSALNSFLVDRLTVDGTTLSALNDGRGPDTAALAGLAERVRRDTVRTATVSGAFQASLTSVTGLSVALVYLCGGLLVVGGHMTVGMLVGFVSLLPSLHGPLTGIVNARVEVVGAMVGFRRIFELLDQRPAVAENPEARPLAARPTRLSFDGVCFAHAAEAQSWRLDDISFELRTGQVVALVGPSGAGKSTIAHLCARLRDPDSGVVRLDGRALPELPLSSVTAQVGLLSQTSYFFHESVAANLRYADPAATDAELVDALRAASIWSGLVARMPAGLDTVLGDHGNRLSGGERQRLAIARLLLRRPAFVVLDEATASLDAATARTVLDTVFEVFADCGILVITHDPAVAARADQVIVLRDGTVVDRGAPAELARRADLTGAGAP